LLQREKKRSGGKQKTISSLKKRKRRCAGGSICEMDAYLLTEKETLGGKGPGGRPARRCLCRHQGRRDQVCMEGAYSLSVTEKGAGKLEASRIKNSRPFLTGEGFPESKRIEDRSLENPKGTIGGKRSGPKYQGSLKHSQRKQLLQREIRATSL